MIRTSLSLVLVAALGCGGDSKPAPRTATPAPAPAAPDRAPAPDASRAPVDDPWAGKPAQADTPETRKQRAEAAIARVATIKPKIAALRDLAFKHDVATAYQTTDEFRAYVKGELVKDLPPARAGEISAALAHIGMIPKPVDLAAVLENTLATQVGAYYDPAQDKFFVVMVPDSEMMLDVMSAHELVHGLQHHHFQLDKLMASGMYNNDAVSEDAATAIRFLVEGDATYAMLVYAVADAMKATKLEPQMAKMLRPQVEQFAAMDTAALKTQMSQQGAAFSSMDPSMKAMFDAVDSIPSAILVPLVGAYTKGALVSAVAFDTGGWRAVDALYANPPQSTEQVLHPATKLFPKREMPVTVTFPVGKDAIVTDVVGELGWWIYFDQWANKSDERGTRSSAEGDAKVNNKATLASEGWGGDTWSVARRADGRLVASIATTWDTPADAKQFAEAYTASLATRFPAAGTTDATKGVPRPDGGKVFLRLAGKNVFIVDGADDTKPLDALVKSTKLSTRTK